MSIVKLDLFPHSINNNVQILRRIGIHDDCFIQLTLQRNVLCRALFQVLSYWQVFKQFLSSSFFVAVLPLV